MEVLVVSILTMVVLTMGYGILNTSTKTATTIGNRAHNSTEARLTIDTLEASLRSAKGVWICAPVSATPQTASTATVSCPAYTSGAAALLVSNDTTPTCSEWVLGSTALYQVGLGTVASGSFPLSPLTNIPGVVAATYNGVQTTGFTLGLPAAVGAPAGALLGQLVQIDLSVNQDPTASYTSKDAVTVHDEIAPDNLMTNDDTTAVPCS